MRHLDEDARAVAGLGVGPAGASVPQVYQDLESLGHDRVGLPALDVGNEADSTGVVLEAGVV